MVTANLGSSRSAASSAWQVDSTSALLFVDTTNVPSAGWYYAIGVQQWGVIPGTTKSNPTITLPIALQEEYFFAAGKYIDYARASNSEYGYILFKNFDRF